MFYQTIMMIHEIISRHVSWYLRGKQWKFLLMILTPYIPNYIFLLSYPSIIPYLP